MTQNEILDTSHFEQGADIVLRAITSRTGFGAPVSDSLKHKLMYIVSDVNPARLPMLSNKSWEILGGYVAAFGTAALNTDEEELVLALRHILVALMVRDKMDG